MNLKKKQSSSDPASSQSSVLTPRLKASVDLDPDLPWHCGGWDPVETECLYKHLYKHYYNNVSAIVGTTEQGTVLYRQAKNHGCCPEALWR